MAVDGAETLVAAPAWGLAAWVCIWVVSGMIRQGRNNSARPFATRLITVTV